MVKRCFHDVMQTALEIWKIPWLILINYLSDYSRLAEWKPLFHSAQTHSGSSWCVALTQMFFHFGTVAWFLTCHVEIASFHRIFAHKYDRMLDIVLKCDKHCQCGTDARNITDTRISRQHPWTPMYISEPFPILNLLEIAKYPKLCW